MSAKIKEMLRARHASNKRRKWRSGCIRLNDQEVAVVQSREPRLAKTFFERFYPWCRAHGIEIEEGVERSLDILTREMQITMRAIGAPSLADLGPHTIAEP